MFDKKSDAEKDLAAILKLLERIEVKITKLDSRTQVLEQELKELKKELKKS